MRNRLITYGTFAIVAATAIGLMSFSFVSANTVERTTINVVLKQSIVEVRGSDGYTTSNIKKYVHGDEDIYTVDDSLFKMKWYSNATFSAIQENSKCDVELQGIRFGFLNSKYNIIEVFSCEPQTKG